MSVFVIFHTEKKVRERERESENIQGTPWITLKKYGSLSLFLCVGWLVSQVLAFGVHNNNNKQEKLFSHSNYNNIAPNFPSFLGVKDLLFLVIHGYCIVILMWIVFVIYCWWISLLFHNCLYLKIDFKKVMMPTVHKSENKGRVCTTLNWSILLTQVCFQCLKTWLIWLKHTEKCE